MDSNLITTAMLDLVLVGLGVLLGFIITRASLANKKYDQETHEIDLSTKILEKNLEISWYRYSLKILADRGEEFAATALNAGERFYGK